MCRYRHKLFLVQHTISQTIVFKIFTTKLKNITLLCTTVNGPHVSIYTYIHTDPHLWCISSLFSQLKRKLQTHRASLYITFQEPVRCFTDLALDKKVKEALCLTNDLALIENPSILLYALKPNIGTTGSKDLTTDLLFFIKIATTFNFQFLNFQKAIWFLVKDLGTRIECNTNFKSGTNIITEVWTFNHLLNN